MPLFSRSRKASEEEEEELIPPAPMYCTRISKEEYERQRDILTPEICGQSGPAAMAYQAAHNPHLMSGAANTKDTTRSRFTNPFKRHKEKVQEKARMKEEIVYRNTLYMVKKDEDAPAYAPGLGLTPSEYQRFCQSELRRLGDPATRPMAELVLKEHIEVLDASGLKRLLPHMCCDPPDPRDSRSAAWVLMFAEVARQKGTLVAPHARTVALCLQRTLRTSAIAEATRLSACAEAASAMITEIPVSEVEAKIRTLQAVIAVFAPSLTDTCEPLAVGAAMVLRLVVDSIAQPEGSSLEKGHGNQAMWDQAVARLIEDLAGRAVSVLVGPSSAARTVARLGLAAAALPPASKSVRQKYTPPVAGAAAQLLAGESFSWKERAAAAEILGVLTGAGCFADLEAAPGSSGGGAQASELLKCCCELLARHRQDKSKPVRDAVWRALQMVEGDLPARSDQCGLLSTTPSKSTANNRTPSKRPKAPSPASEAVAGQKARTPGKATAKSPGRNPRTPGKATAKSPGRNPRRRLATTPAKSPSGRRRHPEPLEAIEARKRAERVAQEEEAAEVERLRREKDEADAARARQLQAAEQAKALEEETSRRAAEESAAHARAEKEGRMAARKSLEAAERARLLAMEAEEARRLLEDETESNRRAAEEAKRLAQEAGAVEASIARGRVEAERRAAEATAEEASRAEDEDARVSESVAAARAAAEEGARKAEDERAAAAAAATPIEARELPAGASPGVWHRVAQGESTPAAARRAQGVAATPAAFWDCLKTPVAESGAPAVASPPVREEGGEEEGGPGPAQACESPDLRAAEELVEAVGAATPTSPAEPLGEAKTPGPAPAPPGGWLKTPAPIKCYSPWVNPRDSQDGSLAPGSGDARRASLDHAGGGGLSDSTNSPARRELRTVRKAQARLPPAAIAAIEDLTAEEQDKENAGASSLRTSGSSLRGSLRGHLVFGSVEASAEQEEKPGSPSAGEGVDLSADEQAWYAATLEAARKAGEEEAEEEVVVEEKEEVVDEEALAAAEYAAEAERLAREEAELLAAEVAAEEAERKAEEHRQLEEEANELEMELQMLEAERIAVEEAATAAEAERIAEKEEARLEAERIAAAAAAAEAERIAEEQAAAAAEAERVAAEEAAAAAAAKAERVAAELAAAEAARVAEEEAAALAAEAERVAAELAAAEAARIAEEEASAAAAEEEARLEAEASEFASQLVTETISAVVRQLEEQAAAAAEAERVAAEVAAAAAAAEAERVAVELAAAEVARVAEEEAAAAAAEAERVAEEEAAALAAEAERVAAELAAAEAARIADEDASAAAAEAERVAAEQAAAAAAAEAERVAAEMAAAKAARIAEEEAAAAAAEAERIAAEMAAAEAARVAAEQAAAATAAEAERVAAEMAAAEAARVAEEEAAALAAEAERVAAELAAAEAVRVAEEEASVAAAAAEAEAEHAEEEAAALYAAMEEAAACEAARLAEEDAAPDAFFSPEPAPAPMPPPRKSLNMLKRSTIDLGWSKDPLPTAEPLAPVPLAEVGPEGKLQLSQEMLREPAGRSVLGKSVAAVFGAVDVLSSTHPKATAVVAGATFLGAASALYASWRLQEEGVGMVSLGDEAFGGASLLA